MLVFFISSIMHQVELLVFTVKVYVVRVGRSPLLEL